MPSDPADPPARPLLVDTNVLTWLLNRKSPRPEWDRLTTGRTLYLSFATVGEILHGAQLWGADRRQALEDRLASWPVIPGTIGVARTFAQLRARYHSQIGDNDLWIAACALSWPDPLPLATDDGDFDRIRDEFGLVIERPAPRSEGRSE